MKLYHPTAVSHRARLARAVFLGALVLLLAAFFRTQILAHGELVTRSRENRLRPIRLPAPRGVITDRHGRILAENVPGYTVALLPGPPAAMRPTLQIIAGLAGLDTAEIMAARERQRRSPYLPVTLIRDAPFATVSALEERRAVLPGLLIQSEPKRLYPDRAAVAHLMGYVSEATDQELSTPRFAELAPGAIIGRDGLERTYDERLRGKDGYRLVEVSALGRLVREADSSLTLLPVPGDSVRTTIDLDLQRFAAEIFPRGRRGAILALEPHSGAILALYSSPSFDPNAFVGGIDAGLWHELTTDEAKPLLDRAIQTRYPPASTFKLAVAAIALQRGIAGFHTRMPEPCRGGFQYGNRYFRCWRREGHGRLNLFEAIAHSCDVYFYQLGLRIGVSALLTDAVAMGFDEATGIDLPFETPPLFPHGTEYYDRRYGPRGWTNAVSLNLAIGQGENAQTLISVVRFFAALAGDGRSVIPHLVAPRGSPSRRLDLSPDELAGLRQSLLAVVETGTAQASRLRDLQIAGKTGTAENPHGLDHGWFVGFAPADDPKIVVGVVVEFGEHGSWVAPLGAAVMAYHLVGPEAAASLPFGRLHVPLDTAPAPIPVAPVPPDTQRRP